MPVEGTPPPGGLPQEMPEAWMESVVQKVSVHLQKALTSRDAQADKKREADKLEFKKMLEETLQGIKPGEPPDDKSGKGGKNKTDDVETATLKRKLEELAQRADTFEKKAQEERAKARAQTLAATATHALAQHGIEGIRARGALAILRDRIEFQDEETDAIVFRGDDNITVELPIGLRQWAKSEEAKLYLPPRDTRGSGGRAGGNPGNAGGAMTKEQQLGHLNSLLDREF